VGRGEGERAGIYTDNWHHARIQDTSRGRAGFTVVRGLGVGCCRLVCSVAAVPCSGLRSEAGWLLPAGIVGRAYA